MKNTYKIDFVNNTLTMSKAFEEALNNPTPRNTSCFCNSAPTSPV